MCRQISQGCIISLVPSHPRGLPHQLKRWHAGRLDRVASSLWCRTLPSSGSSSNGPATEIAAATADDASSHLAHAHHTVTGDGPGKNILQKMTLITSDCGALPENQMALNVCRTRRCTASAGRRRGSRTGRPGARPKEMTQPCPVDPHAISSVAARSPPLRSHSSRIPIRVARCGANGYGAAGAQPKR